jgi:hypothetical protein
MFKECRHVMSSGLHCQSPAMRGSVFCYFHARAQRPARPSRSWEARIEIPLVLNQAGILYVLNQIMQALGSGLINSRRAGILLYALQLAGSGQFGLSPALASFPSPFASGGVPGLSDDRSPEEAAAELQALIDEVSADLLHPHEPHPKPHSPRR